jgi:hypothetical protein
MGASEIGLLTLEGGTMKKIEFTAWIGKSWELPRENFLGTNLRTVWLMRGLKSDWDKDDWPPVKVKVTLEEVKK